MDNKSARENLRKFREAKNLSQDAFADEIGISRISYGKLETGRTKLFSRHLSAIAETFGTSIEEILLGFHPVPEGQMMENNGCEEKIRELKNYYENLLDAARSQAAGREEVIKGLQKEVEILKSKLAEKD